MKVKALSIKNPVSYLVACGAKNHEFRTWKTDYRGRIYIHSSGQYDEFSVFEDNMPSKVVKMCRLYEGGVINKPSWYDDLVNVDRLANAFYGVKDLTENEYEVRMAAKTKGLFCRCRSIIGHVDLVDCLPTKDVKSDWNDGDLSGFTWILENATLFSKPLENIAGKLRLFEVEI